MVTESCSQLYCNVRPQRDQLLDRRMEVVEDLWAVAGSLNSIPARIVRRARVPFEVGTWQTVTCASTSVQ